MGFAGSRLSSEVDFGVEDRGGMERCSARGRSLRIRTKLKFGVLDFGALRDWLLALCLSCLRLAAAAYLQLFQQVLDRG